MATKLSRKQQSLVDEIDRRVHMCKEFLNDWLLFNQILSAYPSPGVNKAQLENQFLKIKSKLAREHKVLQDTLQGDYQIDANTMSIVSGATTLEAIYSQSEMAVKKLQGEWHRSFISINETLGSMEDKKARAEAGEKIMLETASGQFGGGGRGGGGGGMSPEAKKNAMILGGFVLLIVVAVAVPPIRQFFIDSFEQLTR